MPSITHFTDIANIPSIFQAGAIRAFRSANCVSDIGHQNIKARRTLIQVPCGPGGCVADYVPFYFAPRSPMLFAISRGGVEGVNHDQSQLCYLVTTTDALDAAGVRWVYTDGNAATAFTAFGDDPAQLEDTVDFPLMKKRYWSNTSEDGDRVRRRAAECLVHGSLPWTLLTQIGVYDAAAQARVQAIVGAATPVNIRSEWYF